MVRYYGWYSSKSRGIRTKAEMPVKSDRKKEKTIQERILDISKHRPENTPSLIWEKAYFACPLSGANIRYAFISTWNSKNSFTELP